MTNPRLKEQLQALSFGSHPPSKSEKKPQKNTAEKKSAKHKPAWLEYAQYGVELLKAHFPLCFRETKEIQPLKVGIKNDLVKLLSSMENIVTTDKACMVNSLAYYVNSPAYHKSVIQNAIRIDLEGQASGVVTVEEAQYSMNFRQAKLEKKAEKNKRPATA